MAREAGRHRVQAGLVRLKENYLPTSGQGPEK